MAGKQSSYRKNLEFIAKDIGEELIPFLSKEKMLKHITPEERVRGLTLEERLRGLDPQIQKKIEQLIFSALKTEIKNIKKGNFT